MSSIEAADTPKGATPSVIAQQTAMLNALPFSDTRDFDDAARGFLGTIENAEITNQQGRTVWSLEPYGFLSAEQAPTTVNPACGGSRGSTCSTACSRSCPAFTRCVGSTSPT